MNVGYEVTVSLVMLSFARVSNKVVSLDTCVDYNFLSCNFASEPSFVLDHGHHEKFVKMVVNMADIVFDGMGGILCVSECSPESCL